MKAIFIMLLSSLFCFVYSQPELTIEESISDSGVKLISTKSITLNNICFTEDETNSIDITICHNKWEDSFSFYFLCDLWLNLNISSLSETSLAIVLEDERIVYMLQDGEAPSNDKKSDFVESNKGKIRPIVITRFSTSYDPKAVDEEIETMKEAWDALKSCKFTEIHLVFPEEQVELTFYPVKSFKRDNSLIFIDYLKAIDESQLDMKAKK